jgi:hypothetical protein
VSSSDSADGCDQLTETEAEDAAFETFVRELAARTDRQLVDLLAEPLDLEDAIGKPPDLAELLTEPPDLADAISSWSFLVRKGGLENWEGNP